MNFSCASHIGKIRKNNEDYCKGKIIQNDTLGIVGIFAMADGMGGHKKGEVASKIAVDDIIEFLEENLIQNNHIKIDYIDDIIKQAYNNVNLDIYRKSKKNLEFYGMGTTLTTAIIYKDKLYVANVGDSRCYILQNNEIKKITIDHSIVEEYVRANIITEEEAKKHPKRNLITRAMGTDHMVLVDIFKINLNKDDKILLATDGLTGCVEDRDIKKIIEKNDTLESLNKELIDMANELSGKDNVSVILINCK